MAESADSKVIDVLLVEDDDGDVVMTREAFEYYKIRNRLHVVQDGEQALQFLRRSGPFADAPRPGLILLDVNLPRRSGLEVLAELKQDDELLMCAGMIRRLSHSPTSHARPIENRPPIAASAE
jgi:CheY-like chemotaxis protein